ncbi:ATP-binding cassette domain-containing protein [Actinoplanes sp. NPDC026623]|uniref:ATP-binding cassette domain-containing protein n=1 Tax=Actinoplanes sp. NPDC026623 TaxID=3155610 RepID=UPI0034023ED6
MPVLTATGVGVRRHRRWLFRDLDVAADPGDIVAIVGPPGSGRTTVLLALARRFKLSAGSVVGSAALGYVPEVTSPEPVLTVLEHVRERLLLVGRSPRQAAEVPLLGLDPALKGYQLSPYQRQVLGLVLARLENPRVVALDGIDEGLDHRESASLWGLLADLAAEGLAVLVTAREVDPARVSTSIRLGGTAAAPPVSPSAGPYPADELAAQDRPETEDELAAHDRPETEDELAAHDRPETEDELAAHDRPGIEDEPVVHDRPEAEDGPAEADDAEAVDGGRTVAGRGEEAAENQAVVAENQAVVAENQAVVAEDEDLPGEEKS